MALPAMDALPISGFRLQRVTCQQHPTTTTQKLYLCVPLVRCVIKTGTSVRKEKVKEIENISRLATWPTCIISFDM